jgi:hypothetical protein
MNALWVIEIKVLMQEIRKCLPQLEQEALHLEAYLHTYQKGAVKTQARSAFIPQDFSKSIEDLQV